MKKITIRIMTGFLLLLAEMSYGQVTKMPAYPLITHNVYFNIWSAGDQLNATTTRHWSGASQPLTGMIKVDDSTYNFLGLSSVDKYKPVLPASDEAKYTCPYLETTASAGWQNLSFDDSQWPLGSGVFSNDPRKQTAWYTPDIYIRRVFSMDTLNTDSLLLKLYHDDNVEVYLNGVEVYSQTGYNTTYDTIAIKNTLVKGANILAVHCHNTAGGAQLDVGLMDGNKSASHNNIVNAQQTGINVTATQTQYTFKCGGVDLNLSFISPLLLDDLDVLSRPVSYIKYDVKANDGKTHQVKVYLGVSGDLSRNQPNEITDCSKYTSGGMSILKGGTLNQVPLKNSPNIPDWGYEYVAVPSSAQPTQFFSTAQQAVNPFNRTDTTATSFQSDIAVLSTIIPMGTVGADVVERYAEIGYDDLYTIQYFGQNLQPWWKAAEGNTMEDVLSKSSTGYNSIVSRCNDFDNKLYTDAIKAGGDSYAKLCVMAYRQAIAAAELTKSPQGDTLFMQNEISSGGFVNTVDVVFPASPIFALYNPSLLKALMNGEFYYTGTNGWTDNFAPHDIGGYPFATGNKYPFGMPIEESGNMVLMAAMITKADGNANYARKHWATLTKWANYLNNIGYDPPSQLTSDDFAGVIAHSLNLSAKLINSVAAYAGMARAMGDTAKFNQYYASAKQMAASWVAAGDTGDHSLLAFDQPGTWSEKYNIVWDKVLGLKLFPESVYDKDTKFYISQINTFGVPLDSRKAYTKSDWSLWTALMANDTADFKKLIAPLYTFATTSQGRIPLSDFYQTTDGTVQSNFRARPVVGAFFIRMLQRNWQLDTLCTTPATLFTDSITQTQAILHWAKTGSAENYNLQYKQTGSTQWHTITLPATDSVYTLSGLLPKTAYQWQIRSICQSQPLIVSDYSATQAFTTLALPDTINNKGQFSIYLSPNPASQMANVRIYNAKGASSVRLVSMSGRTLWRMDNITISNVSIPLNNVATGVYVVWVQNNGRHRALKLIKSN